MGKPIWRKLAITLAIIPALGLAACSSTGGRAPEPESNAGGGAVAATDRIKIAVITHAAPGDTFWDILRKGAEEASAKDNVELQYLSDPDGGRQSQLIEQAIDQGVDGIAVTLAKPDAMAGALGKAADAGIPIVSLNAGEARFKDLGAFAHFGSNEQLAGQAAGEKLKEAGIKKPICVIQEQGHVGLEARCAGVKKIVPDTEILYVQGTDMTQVESTATAKLQADKQADAIIGLGAPITMTLLKAKATAKSEVEVASFDMNSQLVEEITKGNVMFTVDQQPWLQGYMAVDALWQNNRGGFTIGGGQATLSGPAVVDKAVAEQITSFAQEGVR
ncbi:substrate-binding domain-containing protein [Arthrobacter sp. JUb115]|uniref:substrate-binding domain-containing protein n=1 Tax=Arthrobacter sp. JUb115 TaxID=2485108 RepID=UPI00105D19AB|nr:substrate-binding domain-containing protein [Arthrobacter sp. JUb115]TDU27164.1 monosaccharide ABC transporter substrate-binding protein (CUT2 family) [Arthrobacter sp. JUb115]